jgi:tetratricopeptide (TPR) repeat protein
MISRLTHNVIPAHNVILSAAKNPSPNKIKLELAPDRQVGVGFATILGALVLLTVFVFNIQPARANMKTLDALRLLNQDPNLGAIAMKDALAFNSPHIDDIRSDIGRTAGQILAGNYQKIGKDRSTEIFELAYTNLQKNLVLHPRDIRNQLTLSQLAQTGYLIENKPQYIYEAEKFLTDALQYSPQRQQIKYSLSAIKLQVGKTQEAIRLLEETITEDPKIGESYWRLAYSYKMLGQDNKVREVLALAQQNGVVFSDQDNGIINQILNSLPTATPRKVNK